jgi:putative DNA primase/helicase
VCSSDLSVFVACQPIYIANPKFSGMRDPLPGIRCGLLEGAEDAVNTEAMSLEDAEKDAERHRKVGDVVQRKDVEPCEAQIDSTLAKIRDQVTTDARHFHAMGVIAELYALGCDIPRIHEAAEDVFVRQGRDPRAGEIAEMISYIVRKDQAGALTTRNSPLSQILPDIWASQEEPHPGPGDSGGDVLDDAGHALLSTRHPDGVNAMTYLKHRHVDGGFIRWAEQDWEWDGVCWRRLENKETLKHRIDKLGGASLSDSKARACASKVRGMCAKENLTLPGWISRDAHTDSRAVICKNGMVFIDDAIMDPTTALRPHDMDYFNTFALDFAYDQEADCPTWLRCLDDWFLDDEQTKREIQKMFGYLLVPDNQYEKFFVLTDANGRAGKGTAVQVLTWLLGHGAVGATTFSGFAKDFGLGSLLGKTVGLFNEANAQAQADVPVQAIDRLKSITGNDMVEVERKGVDSVYRQLPLRFVMSCNRMPAFRDPSGALTKRMHLLEFKQSFAGREQTDLKKVGGPLYRELPGILNWAIRGLETLYYEDRAFIRPDAAKEAFEQAERISAPIKAFVSDCLVMVGQAEGFTEKESLYRLFQAWSIHKEGISKPMGREKFFGELRLLCPHRIEQRMRDNRNRSRVWWGVVVSEEGRELIKDGMLEPLDASD